ncbi:3-(3-hydroxy-phenyl)propionate hydroxylase [Nocardioides luteus]|uniref:3-(3-hydroxy-phenyl)propionate/3-hydroxycinnamic acid hydroxylase n=1 Tax=Nocardioides luteus TaxID=1844 RepID=A0ABQ5T1D6_9ACTN|nr:bifunctional 3-(3-hydroxy-phenyl)propionate/3-hydroxycinnamic acid hydroxylase [Nocardioides luteus]MDR7310331.1 3-(3-hydroxy-phenyl)propionate hydroxylase [Nocardioides luteus]GGR53398.1 3-(3-hydroxy-phenyl)propionate/3-hydroxycinnamic acid hydroxylase [Nocardioides luteus]GLJ69889.1 3-(3-hydroxy-phenyl)propionate/3-hydroxycinnamic acid hydroxylase [Nocardioides luteus]
MRAHRDVVVVGAGPIGMVAALLLAESGVTTTILEKQTEPGDLPRAISLQDESFRTFEQIGVADALKAESLLDTGSRYFGLGDRLLLEARPTASRLGHPAKTQFDQPILERLLWERTLAHPDIEFVRGAEVTGLVQDEDGVTVSAVIDGASEQITASWLIGADGGRSFVRTALGIELEGTTQPQRWIVIDLANEPTVRDPFAEFHGDGQRPFVLVPGVDGRLRLEFMLFDDEDPDAMTTPDAIRDLVVPRFRDHLDPADVRRAAVYVAHQRVARTYRSGRAFLVGDAAHLMPPFAGQGLNAGVRDATNLAWKLAEVCRGRAGDRLLDTYEVERRPHGRSMMVVSRRIGAVVMGTNPVATRLRDATVRALSLIPSVRSFLANMRFITPPDYSAGAVVAPEDAALDGVAVGRALSQPAVRDASEKEGGLDAHLGLGWSLLQIGGDSQPAVSPFWDAIGATRVRVLAPGHAPAAGEVAETTPVLTAGAGPAPTFVLVRPDRYVAAVFGAAGETRVIDTLRTFLTEPSPVA